MRRTHPILFAVAVTLVLAVPAVTLAGWLAVAPDRVAAIQNPEVENDGRFLMGFELPSALAQGAVELAVVEFRAAVSSPDTACPVRIDAFLLTSHWDEGSVVWGRGWDTPGGDFDRTAHARWTAVPGDTSVVRLDLTKIVGAWAATESPNHGVIVAVAAGERGAFVPRCFASVAEQPKLTVWYTPQRR